MRLNKLVLIFFITLTCLHLNSCEKGNHADTEDNENGPARVEAVPNSDLKRIILTADAAKKIDLQMVPLKSMQINGVGHKTVPYTAILYDMNGLTWVYKSIGNLVFIRAQVVIDAILDDTVILSDGPAEGTMIVTVGTSQLFGSEFLGTIES